MASDEEVTTALEQMAGLPTILIELAVAGTPIVASAVGGVPELVDGDTGWPVTEVDDPQAYVQALRAMIDAPTERMLRAERLRERAWARHSQSACDRVLAEVIGLEHRR